MKFELLLSLKFLFFKKKRNTLLLFAVALISAVIAIMTIMLYSSVQKSVSEEKAQYGDWHLCYRMKDSGAVEEIRDSPLVEDVRTGSRLERIKSDNVGVNIDLTFVSGGADMMFSLSEGAKPRKKREIAVEEWFLRKCGIKSLPYEITTQDGAFTITGAFKSESKAYNSVRAYADYDANRELLKTDNLLQDPVGNNYLNLKMDAKNSKENTTFVFIRLKKNVSLEKAVAAFEKIKGISAFDSADELMLLKNYDVATPLYNINLLGAERFSGASAFSKCSTAQGSEKWYHTLQIMLIAFMCVMIYISLKILIGGGVRELGLLSAVGMKQSGMFLVLLNQVVLISVLGIPIGTFAGMGAASALFGNITGFGVPYGSIALMAVISFACAVAFSCIPVVKACLMPPVEAIKATGTGNRNYSGANLPRLGFIRGKTAFAFIYGIKTAFKNGRRTIGFTAAIAVLLASFISLTQQIETTWKTGNERRSYSSDYEISIPYVNNTDFDNIYLTGIKSPDSGFFTKLNNVPDITDIYSQSGIVSKCDLGFSSAKGKTLYNYCFKIPPSFITKQGRNAFNLGGVPQKSNYPGSCFTNCAVNGYGDRELSYLKKHIVEGSVDIEKMKSERIILLPKYIKNISNMNIPYTNYKVGDKITLALDTSDDYTKVNIAKQYDFIIGGFVDCVPFEAYPFGAGFDGVISEKQLDGIAGDVRGIMQIWVNEKKSSNSYSKLKKLCDSYKYKLTDNKHSFEHSENERIDKAETAEIYILFGTLGLIMLLCILSIFISEMLLRKSEFAMLCAIGMTKGQIAGSIFSEVLVFDILGCIAGFVFGLYLIKDAPRQLGTALTFAETIPWIHICVFVALLFAVSIAASVLSSVYCLKNISVRDVHIAE